MLEGEKKKKKSIKLYCLDHRYRGTLFSVQVLPTENVDVVFFLVFPVSRQVQDVPLRVISPS